MVHKTVTRVGVANSIEVISCRVDFVLMDDDWHFTVAASGTEFHFLPAVISTLRKWK
jgi:hypothetical protein